MPDRHQEQWERLGAHDPYWAVLTDPAGKGGNWDKREFFASGSREIEQVLAKLARLDVVRRRDSALDFGCGVGRLSQALAQHFDKVVAVDISQAMLDEARAQHHEIANIEFLHNPTPRLGAIANASIDLVYSNIVLQHMPAQRQIGFIEEFCRVLRPGGVAVFQTPAGHKLGTLSGCLHRFAGNRLLNIARRAVHGKNGVMEVHTLAKAKILATLATHAMSLLETERDNAAGKGFVSHRYFAIKR